MASTLNDDGTPDDSDMEPTVDDDGTMTVDSPDDTPDLVMNDDGTATLLEAPVDEPADNSDFMSNIAISMEMSELKAMATEFLECLDRDKDARKDRDKQYADGLKRTGLDDSAPGGADFDGSSTAVAPILLQGCVDFASAAIKELFPPNGPVKTKIIGDADHDKIAKAERKCDYMNWQTTTQIIEYRDELHKMLTQVPMAGSQFLKVWYDESLERARVDFVPIDEVLLPGSAANLRSASRVTHMQRISRYEFEKRVESGLYIEPSMMTATSTPDNTQAGAVSDRIEGVDDYAYDEDGLRIIYEIYTYADIPEDGTASGSAPYIITVDEPSGEVIAIYRNWDEKDKKQQRLDWLVEFKFIPWRGAYGIGLAQLIGSLQVAATGALRALLDSAMINNFPGGLKLRGAGRSAGESVSVNATELTSIDLPEGTDDIRKAVMPFPFKGPDGTLFQLLNLLIDQAQSTVRTAEDKIAEGGANQPVGTTLAMIEQGSKNFSSIHAGLHQSQAQTLAIIHRINATYLDDEVTVEELGDLVVQRADFQGPMDIQPVSDPNIFSESQRLAQVQALYALAKDDPNAFDMNEIRTRYLQAMRIDGAEAVLKIPKEPKKTDAISENVAAANGDAVKAFPDQMHLEHIKTHIAFLMDPITGDMFAAPALQILLNHIKEHILDMYQENFAASHAVNKTLLKIHPDEAGANTGIAAQQVAQQLAPLMPMIQQLEQKLQKMQPQPPQDPTVQVGMAEIARKTTADKADHDYRMAELAQKSALQSQADQNALELADMKGLHQEQYAILLNEIKENASIAESLRTMYLNLSQQLIGAHVPQMVPSAPNPASIVGPDGQPAPPTLPGPQNPGEPMPDATQPSPSNPAPVPTGLPQ